MSQTRFINPPALRRPPGYTHVVEVNNYLVDRAHLPTFREVRDSYLAENDRPASTTIAISGLAREGALIEIEAVAVLPAAARAKTASRSASKSAAKAAGKTRSAREPRRRARPRRR